MSEILTGGSFPEHVKTYPHVTQITGVVHTGLHDFMATKKGALIVEDKGRAGTQVHDLIRSEILGEHYDVKDYFPEIEARFWSWKRWSDANIERYLAVELKVWSDRIQFCGTLDAVGIMKRSKGLALFDWKNAVTMSKTYDYQTAGYAVALAEMKVLEAPIRRRYLIKINESMTSAKEQLDLDRNRTMFLYCREIYRDLNGK